MRIIADFHIHSKYSRATSRDMDIPHINDWAKKKGIDLIGTGDFTHPLWLGQIKQELKEDGSGFLTLKHNPSINSPRLILTGEISSIYTHNGKVRKIHTLIFVPDVATAQKINDKLTGIGNLYSDGRPILGLSAKDLAKIILNINPQSLIIPAHIWTPWFSLFGSNSGYDSFQECYEDLSDEIASMETGLSSDPEMNWRLSDLDNISLISNSDAHSPANLGREANVFEIDKQKFSYQEIADILRKKDKKRFLYTIEFYPEEGKYHFDGHRKCDVLVDPSKDKYENDLCPKCSKKMTVGVLNRVNYLADRNLGYNNSSFPKYKKLVPLAEIIAASFSCGVNSGKVQKEYSSIINKIGSEFKILLDLSKDELEKNLDWKIADGINRVREGNISIKPGYDGVYGKVEVFDSVLNKEAQPNQSTLF